jgi:hypothetical protein
MVKFRVTRHQENNVAKASALVSVLRSGARNNIYRIWN